MQLHLKRAGSTEASSLLGHAVEVVPAAEADNFVKIKLLRHLF